MRSAIVTVVVALVVIYIGAQALTVYRAKGELRQTVKRYLDFVDDNNSAEVKRDLVRDAQKLGVTLSPDNIHITYGDTDVQSAAQQLVGRKLGAQYHNKRVVITVRYTAHVVMLPVALEVSEFKITQVSAPVIPPSREVQELLDTP
ncbi:MAG: hypothetical protein PCFJNLEI_02974 [Verrucomicrobiae bacterium]|nr:hypothetical protein [Verrucomicrobiae bacterium]